MQDKHKKQRRAFWWGAVVGGGLMAWWVWRQRRRRSLPQLETSRPGTALVTGASSGIGMAFARALARQGYDLVLLARRRERLVALAEALTCDCGVRAEVWVADLSEPAEIEAIAARVVKLKDLVLLVNNAGFGTAGRFWTVESAAQTAMGQVHVIAPTRLTRAALPGMLVRQKGAIINVSSVSAFIPFPGNVTYGATKAYLNLFSRTLQQELQGTGIQVQALCPGMTTSEFHDAIGMARSRMPGLLWMSAEDVVEHSLRDLQAGKMISIPGIGNQMIVQILQLLPGWVPLLVEKSRALQTIRERRPFKRRIYRSWEECRRDLSFSFRNWDQILNVIPKLSPSFRERLMLAVTQVNQCRYCTYVHSHQALIDGIGSEEVRALLSGQFEKCPESELPAILYAQHWAETRGKPESAAREKVIVCYGEQQTEAIEAALQMVMAGNYLGNTLDYLLHQISGGLWGGETA